MSSFINHVQSIRTIGRDITILDLESGKKLVRFSIATNEYYRNARGKGGLLTEDKPNEVAVLQ